MKYHVLQPYGVCRMSKTKIPVPNCADLRPVLAYGSEVSTLMMAEVKEAKVRFWWGLTDPVG